MIEIETPQDAAEPPRPLWQSLTRGFAQACPHCGTGQLYTAYLKVAPACASCGEELHHQRADDGPPYFTMIIVAHVVVAGLLLMEQTLAPPTWVHLAIWLPLTVIMSLWLLPRVKGTIVGLQWALRMHGFGGEEPQPADPLPPSDAV